MRVTRCRYQAHHDPDGPAHIRRHRVTADGTGLIGGEVIAECDAGFFDGFRMDADGRIWTSAGDGVHCLDADGAAWQKSGYRVVANVCFGGASATLFMPPPHRFVFCLNVCGA